MKRIKDKESGSRDVRIQGKKEGKTNEVVDKRRGYGKEVGHKGRRK